MENRGAEKPANTPRTPAGDGVDRAAYPFADRFAAVPAGRMHYVDEGQGPAILFVHGTPTWSFEWRHLIRALSAEYRCVAPDHIGFGLSDRPCDFAYTPEAHAENLRVFAEALDLREITLVVHDFGGPIGLPLALAENSRIRRVVIVNSWMWSFAGDKAMERIGRLAGTGLWKFLYRRANLSLRMLTPYAYGDRAKLTLAIHRQYLDRFPDPDSRGRVLWALAKALLGSGPFYASLFEKRAVLAKLPVLIIWGLKDRAFPPYLLARWREALPGAQAAELPAAGHWPHEEDPDAVVRALREFLRVP